jgi:predicted MFS family arabinose efflux permease
VGVVSAGGSVGQLLLAPATAFAITSVGWSGAMIALGLLALAALPLSGVLRAPANSDASRDRAPVTPSAGADTGLRDALRNRDYWLITVGFFVCGFHVTFLTTHMPGVIEMCGFSPNFAGAWLAIIGACNIAGTIGAGWLMQRVPMKLILGALYALRGLGVALFLIAPKTEFVLLAFAVWMGLSYLATLPPTTGLIAQLFGMRHVGVLLGLTMFAHQIGSFLGAWLGGLERQWHGSYTWTWLLDIALALVAAAVHAPIRERAPADPVPAERVSSEPATTISRRPSTSPRTLHPLAAR